MKSVVFSFFVLMVCVASFAQEKVGCKEAEEFGHLVYIYTDAMPGEDHRELLSQMRSLVKDACRLGKYNLGDTIYYRNGRGATYAAGEEGTTWYYPNGHAATYYTEREGVTWYYPDGHAATYGSYRPNVSWYYPTGNAITYRAGEEAASYYLRDGRQSLDRAPSFVDENGKLDMTSFLQFVYELE